MGGFSYRNHELFCEEVKIQEIAEDIGTPFYLYNYDIIVGNYQRFIEAFKEFSPLICYAYKANSNLAICKVLASKGCGADIFSGGELFKARKAGVPPDKIVFNGNGKTRQEIEYALEENILMFNVDQRDELLLLNELAKKKEKVARISVRVNPQIDPKTHPYVATGLANSKFGLSFHQAEEVYRLATELKNIHILGIHTHIGSQITKTGPYLETLKMLNEIISRLEKTGIEIRYLNLGGGFGIAYREETVPSPQEFATMLSPYINRDYRLILEPGRAIVGNAGILVTKVLYVKNTPSKTFIVVDCAMNDLIRPALYNSFHRILPVNNKGSEKDKTFLVDIVGPICEDGDFLGKDRRLPALRPGDLLAILDTGAYGYAMSSNYNLRLRVSEVMVIKDRYYTIRESETYEDLIAKEIIPEEME
ncbi:MAG: diaminopimelate decarboxylase [bacterium]|nr:diaminopimelate decarboxylase [bacterium]